MPGRDGTGPGGKGMFTGRGEGNCMLRLPEPGSGEPAVGYAGIQGTLVRLDEPAVGALSHPDRGGLDLAEPRILPRFRDRRGYHGGRRCGRGRR